MNDFYHRPPMMESNSPMPEAEASPALPDGGVAPPSGPASGTEAAPDGSRIAVTQAQDIDGWKPIDLDLIQPSTAPAPPFPLDVLPAHVRRLISNLAEQRDLQVDFVAGAVLGSFAIAIGNRARLVGYDGEAEPPALFICLVGPPSTGKSKALAIANKQLSRIEAAMIEAYDAAKKPEEYSLSALASVLRETVTKRLKIEGRVHAAGEPEEDIGAPPGLLLTEVTVAGLLAELEGSEDGRGILHHELTSALALSGSRDANKSRALLLQGFDGEPYRKRTATGGRIVIPALHLNILGATQPDRVKLLVGTARDGLVPRFLWVVPDTTPKATMALGAGDMQAFEEAALRLIKIEPVQDEGGYARRIALLEEARPVIEAASARWIDEMRKAEGLMQDVHGRARQQALRLATVLAQAEHALAGSEGAITTLGAADVRRGIELVDRYFVTMAERAIGYAGAPVASDATRLARHLRRLGKPVVGVRDDLERGAGSPVRIPAAIARALEELRQRGFVRDVPRSSSVGRPKLLIEVHPDLIAG